MKITSNKNKFPLLEPGKFCSILAMPIPNPLTEEEYIEFYSISFLGNSVREIDGDSYLMFVLPNGWELSNLYEIIRKYFSAVKISRGIL